MFIYQNSIKVVYHNTQSLNKNFDFVKNDRFFKRADILFLFETWSLKEDNYDMKNFNCLTRKDCNSTSRQPFGYICYVKKNIAKDINIVYQNTYYNTQNNKNYFSICILKYKSNFLCALYKSPTFPVSCLKNILNDLLKTFNNKYSKIIFFGDFNINIKTNSTDSNKSSFNEYMNELNLFSNIDSNFSFSTNFDTQIDLVFSNITQNTSIVILKVFIATINQYG